ncbi:MAG: HTTM domain-containing protein [Verrucomicrobia bacterium]|nr:HTTM domain-containing protein [Verrucomicrobiota bacterium]
MRTEGLLSRCVSSLVDDIDGLPLRVFEVLFTVTYLLRMGWQGVSWREWLTEEGFHLNAEELAAVGSPEALPLLTQSGVALLAVVICFSATGLICNRSRRLALLGLFVTAIYTQGVDWAAAFSLNKFYVAIYGLLLVTPGYVRDAVNGRLIISAVPVRLVQGTLICQYLASGTAKAFKGDWLKHSDVLYTLIQGLHRTEFAAWCLRTLPVWSWTAMQWTTLLFELEAPVLFCVKKLRPIAFVIGIGLHLMIALMMKNLIFFSAQMWSFYALFITADEYRWAWDRLKRLCGKGRAAALEVR